MRNFRPSKSRLITKKRNFVAQVSFSLDHPRRFLVTWSGNDHETTHENETKRPVGYELSRVALGTRMGEEGEVRSWLEG